MESQISQKLIELNHQFYQTFSASFSSTRFSVQPGVKKIINEYIQTAKDGFPCSILDIGCGNGELARYLGKINFCGKYIGLDSSASLLSYCERIPRASMVQRDFLVRDITETDWVEDFPTSTFDLIVSFAVLHHIPGCDLRINILRSIRNLISANGLFIHSQWQFVNSPKLVKRIIPWNTIGLSPSQLEPGDSLLDWRAEAGRNGYRYVHLFTEKELARYAEETGFEIIDSYHSDGKEGNLALYQVWKPIVTNAMKHPDLYSLEK